MILSQHLKTIEDWRKEKDLNRNSAYRVVFPDPQSNSLPIQDRNLYWMMMCSWRNGDNNVAATAAAAVPSAQPALADGAAAQSAAAVAAADATAGPGAVADRAAAV